MGFMDSKEVLILMDVGKKDGTYMTEDELKAWFDCGIGTVQYFYTSWGDIETAFGQYNWGVVEDRLSTMLKIGYKVLLMANCDCPRWFSREWYAATNWGYFREYLSPWNPEAQEYMLGYIRTFRDHFNCDQVLSIDGFWKSGEIISPGVPTYYSGCALDNYRKRWNVERDPSPREQYTEWWLKETFVSMMVAQQKEFVQNKWREIWSLMHPEIARQTYLYGTGANHIFDIYDAYRDEVKPDNFGQIWYTCIQHGKAYSDYIRMMDDYKLNAFGGGEHCEGLPLTVPFAKKLGLKGLLFGPQHEFTDHLTIEPWMLEITKWAVKELQS